MTKKTQDDQDKKLKEANKVAKAESVEATNVENEKPDAEKVELVAPLWKDRLLSVDHWLRFGFMALFILILSVVSYLIVGLVILQFCWALIAGEGNDKLRDFGSSVSRFILHVLRFLTYNTDIKPFPFTDWPESENDDLDK
ncbi:MAG: hypothetical protein ACJAUT_000282 [Cellvibrionaceae bacterium]|jgi:hypothetical protein